MKTSVRYKEFSLTINYDKDCIRIEDAYRIVDKTIMKLILTKIVNKAAEQDIQYKRSITSMVNSWATLKYVYETTIRPGRDGSLSIKDNESLFKRCVYWFVSNCLY